MTGEDLLRLDEYLAPVTYLELKQQWVAFVDQLDGYPHSIYDYDNDVDARVMIAHASATLPMSIQVKVWHDLHELDSKFIDATVQADRRKYPSNSWHARVPARPGGELLSDIESGNL